jgi:hypothetical protein
MSTCRSCQARITWLETAAGKPIPVNEAPDPDGNIVAIGKMAHVLKKGEATEEPLYLSHFVTCKDADHWRRR